MRLLVITTNPWDDRIASGNTLSNLLGGLNSDDIFCIYSREAHPYNSCCNHYYTVPLLNLLRHYFIPKRIGRQLDLDDNKSLLDSGHQPKLENTVKRVSKQYGVVSKNLYVKSYMSMIKQMEN